MDPLPPPRIVGLGAIFHDTLLTIPYYPTEDSKLRTISSTSRIGGNVINLFRVLSESPPFRSYPYPSFIFCASVGSVESTSHASCDLKSSGITPAFIHRPRCTGIPTATVLLSAETGSRTIISHHPPGLTAMSGEEMVKRVGEACVSPLAAKNGDWVHCEVRDNAAALGEFLEQVFEDSHDGPVVSLDYEKVPKVEDGEEGWEVLHKLVEWSKVVFVARSYAVEAGRRMRVREDEDQDEGLSLLRTVVRMFLDAGMGNDTVGYLTMGNEGCILFSMNEEVFKGSGEWISGVWYMKLPAEVVEVVESVGAGDAFQAGVLWAAMKDGQEVDWVNCGRIGAAVAARKVQKEGFSGLWDTMA